VDAGGVALERLEPDGGVVAATLDSPGSPSAVCSSRD
jgi:hypothetical protein